MAMAWATAALSVSHSDLGLAHALVPVPATSAPVPPAEEALEPIKGGEESSAALGLQPLQQQADAAGTAGPGAEAEGAPSLRLWLKLVHALPVEGGAAGAGLVLRGFAAPAGGLRPGQAAAVAQLLPPLSLQELPPGSGISAATAPHSVTMLPAERSKAARPPQWLHAAGLPALSPGAVFELRCEGQTEAVATLEAPPARSVGATALQQQRPSFHVVLSPYPELSNGVYAQLLQHHMNYHSYLGFASWLAYAADDALQELRLQLFAQQAAAAGQLRVVSWDSVGTLAATLDVQQRVLLFNHALLALSGVEGGAYVAFLGLDEYLALPQAVAGGMEGALAACLAGAGGSAVAPPRVAAAVLRRVAYGCVNCTGTPELESALWLSSYQSHPLERYYVRLPRQKKGIKVLASADLSYGWRLWSGRTLPGVAPEQEVEVDSSCMYWAHLPSQLPSITAASGSKSSSGAQQGLLLPAATASGSASSAGGGVAGSSSASDSAQSKADDAWHWVLPHLATASTSAGIASVGEDAVAGGVAVSGAELSADSAAGTGGSGVGGSGSGSGSSSSAMGAELSGAALAATGAAADGADVGVDGISGSSTAGSDSSPLLSSNSGGASGTALANGKTSASGGASSRSGGSSLMGSVHGVDSDPGWATTEGGSSSSELLPGALGSNGFLGEAGASSRLH